MEIDYLCPYCNGHLSINNCVVFSAKTRDNKAGLISLHPEIGDYTVQKHPGFEFSEGDELEFYCPICHKDLSSGVHGKLVKVTMVDERQNEFDVLFSKIAGQKSTYKIIGETMEIFGDDSAEYIDFINLSMNF